MEALSEQRFVEPTRPEPSKRSPLAPDTLPDVARRARCRERQDHRRRRYERYERTTTTSRGGASSGVALTADRVRLLELLAQCHLLSLPQLAQLMNLPARATRRHMRLLFDGGLVEVVPVSRAALAGADAPNDARLLYGSAPNIYIPTREGLTVLYEEGLLEKEALKRPLPQYGPKNSLFLRHELAVRDVRVWLERCVRTHGTGNGVRQWQDGAEAILDLGRESFPRQVRPDAWFVLRLQTVPKPGLLLGLVEADRGTERGVARWREKALSYAALFADGARALQEATGQQNARVLVVTPDAARRDYLAQFLEEETANTTLGQRFWLTARDGLARAHLTAAVWRQVGRPDLMPLLRPDQLAGSAETPVEVTHV